MTIVTSSWSSSGCFGTPVLPTSPPLDTSSFVPSTCFTDMPKSPPPLQGKDNTLITTSFATGAETFTGPNATPSGIPYFNSVAYDGHAVLWVEELGLWFVGGNAQGLPSPGPSDLGSLHMSSDGISWSPVLCALQNWVHALAWSPELHLLVAVGQSSTLDFSVPTVPNYIFATSPDGMTWTPRSSGIPISVPTEPRAIWISELGEFVICCGGQAQGYVWVSTDGVTWTSVTNPFTFPATINGFPNALCWAASPVSLLFIGGQSDNATPRTIFYTVDPLTSWTPSPSPADDPTLPSNVVTSIDYSPTLQKIIALGSGVGLATRVISGVVTGGMPAWTFLSDDPTGWPDVFWWPGKAAFCILSGTTSGGAYSTDGTTFSSGTTSGFRGASGPVVGNGPPPISTSQFCSNP